MSTTTAAAAAAQVRGMLEEMNQLAALYQLAWAEVSLLEQEHADVSAQLQQAEPADDMVLYRALLVRDQDIGRERDTWYARIMELDSAIVMLHGAVTQLDPHLLPPLH